MKNMTSLNKNGVSTIAVVAILLIAVVAVATVYVVLNNNDADKDDEIIMGKLGAGSQFYYDVSYPATFGDEADVAYNPPSTNMITAEVIGEDAQYYFLHIILGGANVEVISLKMHKANGSIDQAEKVGDKWEITTIMDYDTEVNLTLSIETYADYGPMISSMDIESKGRLLTAVLDTTKNVLKDPAAYVPPEFFGKHCTYSYDVNAEVIVDSIKNKIIITGTVETKISGSAGDKMVIESEIRLSFESYEDGELIEKTQLESKETFASYYTYEVPDSVTVGEETVIKYNDKDVVVKELKINYLMMGVSFVTTAYVDIEKPIMYESKAHVESPDANIDMNILLKGSNF